jgi:hypothetical protein
MDKNSKRTKNNGPFIWKPKIFASDAKTSNKADFSSTIISDQNFRLKNTLSIENFKKFCQTLYNGTIEEVFNISNVNEQTDQNSSTSGESEILIQTEKFEQNSKMIISKTFQFCKNKIKISINKGIFNMFFY